MSLRIVSTAFHEKGLHTLRNLIAKQVKAKPMLVYALGVLPQITSPAAQDDEAAADDDDEAIFAELTEHMTEEEKREAAGGMGAPATWHCHQSSVSNCCRCAFAAFTLFCSGFRSSGDRSATEA